MTIQGEEHRYSIAIETDPFGGNSLWISEFQNCGLRQDTHTVVVPARDLPEFHRAYIKAYRRLAPKLVVGSSIAPGDEYANAYKRWSPQEDQNLIKSFRAGKSVDELSEAFHRKPSAIRSRLHKLVLCAAYCPDENEC